VWTSLARSGPDCEDGPKGAIDLDSLEHGSPLPGSSESLHAVSPMLTDDETVSHVGAGVGGASGARSAAAAAAMQAAY
jgi:hypothetical protein